MKYGFLIFPILFLTAPLFAQDTYYISQQTGSDENDGLSVGTAFASIDAATALLQPGDELRFVGTFTNESYDPDYEFSGNIDDPYIWHQENTLRFNNLHGAPDDYITLRAHNDQTVLRGDGANIFRMTNCSYLRIEDFEIYGIAEEIPLQTALDLQFLYRENNSTNTLYRVPPGTSDAEVGELTLPVLDHVSRPSYTDTRGIYLSNVHHIELIDNHVHHTGGNGFRVADCDYIDIIGNEVNDCSRKSYSGTHGLVVTNANSFDAQTGAKIRIVGNRVHHNYNEIYSWSPQKTFITPHIDEGKGISLQRNRLSDGWTHGRILVANNLTYWNGFSGVHSNTGIRIDFINNTAYLNSYTGTIGGSMNGRNIGISAQTGDDVRIVNNISVVDGSWDGFALSASNLTNLTIADNLIYSTTTALELDNDVTAVATGTLQAAPHFQDADNLNFGLRADSPAVDAGSAVLAPSDDFNGHPRDAQPDLGALEFGSVSALFAPPATERLAIAPNPTENFIEVNFSETIRTVVLFTGSGRDITHQIGWERTERGLRVDTSRLPVGVYALRVNERAGMVVKL